MVWLHKYVLLRSIEATKKITFQIMGLLAKLTFELVILPSDFLSSL